MSLRKRLQMVFLLILASNFLFGLAYVGNIFWLGSRFRAAQNSANVLRASSKDLANCLLDMEDDARVYLVNPKAENAAKFSAHVDLCSTKINSLKDHFSSPEVAHELRERIKRYKTVTGEIGVRTRSAMDSLTRSQRELARVVPRLGQGASEKRAVEIFSSTALIVGVSILGGTEIDVKELTAMQAEASAALKKGRTKHDVAERAEDAMVDLIGGALVWNKTLAQKKAEYNPVAASVVKIPVDQSADILEACSEKLGTIFGFLRFSSFLSLTLMPLILVAVGFLMRWIFRSWAQTMGLLKDTCIKIVAGHDSIDEQLLPVSGLQPNEDAGDEVTIAVAAIKRTLGELAELRRDLEKKVEDRTASLRAAQEQLVQSAKLAGLGTLSAGVAHELNNPLQVISLYSETLLLTDVPEERRKKGISEIQKQVKRMAQIIEQLKRMARKDSSPRQWSPFSEILENAVILSKARLKGETVELAVAAAPDVELYCKAVQLESVINNLIMNAIDAFSAPNVPADRKRRIQISADLQADDSFLISVSDNASGIPKEFQSRIYEPFFTSKDVGKGTGLGLPMCYQVMREHEGKIWFDTQEDHGTNFKILLPAIAVRAKQAKVS